MQKRGLLTEAATAVGGGGDGGVVYRYVSAIVMFCLRELTENSDDHLQTNEEPVEAAIASLRANE